MGGKQLLGALAGAAYSAAATALLFGALSAVMRVRVAEEEELEGIDERSHGEVAYAKTPRSTTTPSQGAMRFHDEDGASLGSNSAATPWTTTEATQEEEPKQQEEHPQQHEQFHV